MLNLSSVVVLPGVRLVKLSERALREQTRQGVVRWEIKREKEREVKSARKLVFDRHSHFEFHLERFGSETFKYGNSRINSYKAVALLIFSFESQDM